ncbi:helix-turn-helix domain-containing protein [Microbispora sp. H10949]|uniref:AlbA family DNA-binding domain-containing protein n=1 Tax=Microbispora sp. H10949 TaxID=2729111 RepID=UPI00160112A4|nr:ATP-binding protein [Microbispora sp. H10949]
MITTGELAFQHLALLVAGQIPEAEDLDYKRDLYEGNDKGKKSLCGDVAALANTRGGVLIVGADEDDQGRAADLPGVSLSDDEVTRMTSTLVSGLAPRPRFEIIPVENPNQPGAGCYVIAVAAGPQFPYGVLINEGYRYPRRTGTTTGYMAEPEIETAYRRRDAARREQEDRCAQIENLIRDRLSDDDTWVIVSLVPDQPGELVIDAPTFSAFRAARQGTRPLIGYPYAWQRVRLGHRRFLLDASFREGRTAHNLAADLHTDGAGVIAVAVSLFHHNPDTGPLRISDEGLVVAILAGLRFLGNHARETAGASGAAALQVSMAGPLGREWALYHDRNHGFPGALSESVNQIDIRLAQAAAPLDSLQDGQGLVAAAALLSAEIFQGFGVPEAYQITYAGQVRRRYWSRQPFGNLMTAWAEEAGVEISDEQAG